MISKRGLAYLNSYTQSHQTRGNRVTHVIGIPLIVLSLFGFLNQTPAVSCSVIAALISTFYLYQFRVFALPFLILLGAVAVLSTAISLTEHFSFFVLGWSLQLIGHYYYEKKSPSFFRNIAHLFVGPFYLFYRGFGMIRVWNQHPLQKINY